jgi:hypothetical protein
MELIKLPQYCVAFWFHKIMGNVPCFNTAFIL